MKQSLRTVALITAISFSASALGQSTEESPDLQPKFLPLWGIVIKYVAGEAFSLFSQWMVAKMNEKYGLNISSASNSAMALDMARVAIEHFRTSRDNTGGAVIERNPTLAPVALKDAQQPTVGQPAVPLKLSDGTANYQGIHLAIVGADRSGTITALRPVKAGFHTGERFKLRAISTFGGLLVIENINPRGERKQIYPPNAAAVVALQPGSDTLLPLGADEFFEFARTTGEEQLVITLRDPRAVGEAASKEKVYRKDEQYGSHFVQEVRNGTYPAITESIRLQHDL